MGTEGLLRWLPGQGQSLARAALSGGSRLMLYGFGCGLGFVAEADNLVSIVF